MTGGVVETTTLPTRAANAQVVLPRLIVDAGEHASRRFIEFFTANIRNRNTRAAYAHAVSLFCNWCESRGLRLEQLSRSRSRHTSNR